MIISLKMNHRVMQLLALSRTEERQVLGDSEMEIDPGMRKCTLRAMRLEHSYGINIQSTSPLSKGLIGQNNPWLSLFVFHISYFGFQ